MENPDQSPGDDADLPDDGGKPPAGNAELRRGSVELPGGATGAPPEAEGSREAVEYLDPEEPWLARWCIIFLLGIPAFQCYLPVFHEVPYRLRESFRPFYAVLFSREQRLGYAALIVAGAWIVAYRAASGSWKTRVRDACLASVMAAVPQACLVRLIPWW